MHHAWPKRNQAIGLIQSALTPYCTLRNMQRMTKRRYAKRKHLEPARSLISALGGIDAVARIVECNRTSVYRWMLPAESRGTGGFIPSRAQRKLYEYAKANRLPAGVRDFFGAEAA